MSEERNREPMRACVGSVARGICMVCHEEIAGELGLKCVIIGGVPGIMVLIDGRDGAHPIACVQLDVIPVVVR
jgi:hypothetical protein